MIFLGTRWTNRITTFYRPPTFKILVNYVVPTSRLNYTVPEVCSTHVSPTSSTTLVLCNFLLAAESWLSPRRAIAKATSGLSSLRLVTFPLPPRHSPDDLIKSCALTSQKSSAPTCFTPPQTTRLHSQQSCWRCRTNQPPDFNLIEIGQSVIGIRSLLNGPPARNESLLTERLALPKSTISKIKYGVSFGLVRTFVNIQETRQSNLGLSLASSSRENICLPSLGFSNYVRNKRTYRKSFSLLQKRGFHSIPSAMAKSKFEYVKQFEADDPCLQNCWIVVRIDGKAFHKFTDAHHYMKPNDERGLALMTRAAQNVMGEFNEIVLSYGQSDEYSFVFHKHCKLYNRRASKIMTNVVSLFASSFTLFWSRYFNTQELQYPPAFDARVVLYPSEENLKDYLSWRQADCHINNLYNTCFWKLVQEKGMTPAQSQERLKGTLSSDKNEMLFSEFKVNYNTLPELYRKGTVLIRAKDSDSAGLESSGYSNNTSVNSLRHKKSWNRTPSSVVLHVDIISKQFWEEHPDLLLSRK